MSGGSFGGRLRSVALALVVGVAAGFASVVFRHLVLGGTWLATGATQFGQDGRVPSGHLPWLGLWFFPLIPMVGGLLYGPLVQRFAPGARGTGVSQVMQALSERGGVIAPRVGVVKALASALCLATGGSVGREGPVVQIGAALGSGCGRFLSAEPRQLRILAVCGVAGAISATFNAPLAGLLFGLELLLREVRLDAVCALSVSAVAADVVGRWLLGSTPMLAAFATPTWFPHRADYLVVVLFAVLAGAIGLGFQAVFFGVGDICDRVWGERPAWARPVLGGLVLGLLLLAVPRLYGTGYPVMFQALAGSYPIWLLLTMAAAKMFACALTIGIGGSGGVFAPSLFIGAMVGTAFGAASDQLLGHAEGRVAHFAVLGMAAVFAAGTRAPLTAMASMVELTGDVTLLPALLLTVAVAAVLSMLTTRGTLYTTHLLRAGIDVERAPTE